MEWRGSTMRREHERRVRRMIFLTSLSPDVETNQRSRQINLPRRKLLLNSYSTQTHHHPIPHVGRIVAPLASPSYDCNVQLISRAPLNRALILARTLVRGKRRSYSFDASHYLCIIRSSPLQCGKNSIPSPLKQPVLRY